MKIKEIEKIVSDGESATVEFKKSSSNLKSAAETLCAFLNGKGGVVLLGVSDNQKIIGQDVTDQTRQEIANTLRKFEPTANIEVHYIDLPANKKLIALIAHPDHNSLPYAFDGRAYERKESSTSQMPQNKYQQLLLSKKMKSISWEALPALNLSIDDLDQAEILSTFQDIIREKRSESNFSNSDSLEILTRLKLVESDSITNAAVVLFSKEIPGDYFQCVLRMARFKGKEKGNFIDSKHIFGNAFQLLKEAELFINRNTSVASYFKPGEMARVDVPEYPFKAVREALINSICHRDYTSPGGAITITIYDDRLEIANTGLLLSDITIPELKVTHTSHSRNPRITNVFFRRGLIEAMGMGTQQIIKSCAEAHMKEPEFYEQAGAFVVRLWSRHFNSKDKTDENATKEEPITVASLTQRQGQILTILKDGEMATKDIFTLLAEDISPRMLRNDLNYLKNKEFITSIGKGRSAKWRLIGK